MANLTIDLSIHLSIYRSTVLSIYRVSFYSCSAWSCTVWCRCKVSHSVHRPVAVGSLGHRSQLEAAHVNRSVDQLSSTHNRELLSQSCRISFWSLSAAIFMTTQLFNLQCTLHWVPDLTYLSTAVVVAVEVNNVTLPLNCNYVSACSCGTLAGEL